MTIALPVLSLPRPHVPPPAPGQARAAGRLIDSHGRTIRDLRLSVTDRCNFRCVYCMDPGTRFLARDALLNPGELVRVARVCTGLGVEKVRLTGGEPTVHPHLGTIIGSLGLLPLRDLALTTNGSCLEEPRLTEWRRAGLTRVSVSLDSLRPDRFAAMTRSRCAPAEVIAGVRAAMGAGLGPVKINAVVMRGWNEDEVADLAGVARELGVEVRFIEFMPLDGARAWDQASLVAADEILERVGRVYPLVPAPGPRGDGTAQVFEFADGAAGRVGVIASVTRPFCNRCSRLRITADGKVRPCLFSREEWDLRPLLRGGADDREIARFLVDATWTKQAGHGILSSGFRRPERVMSAIGG